jgi:hypothetical protein
MLDKSNSSKTAAFRIAVSRGTATVSVALAGERL